MGASSGRTTTPPSLVSGCSRGSSAPSTFQKTGRSTLPAMSGRSWILRPTLPRRWCRTTSGWRARRTTRGANTPTERSSSDSSPPPKHTCVHRHSHKELTHEFLFSLLLLKGLIPAYNCVKKSNLVPPWWNKTKKEKKKKKKKKKKKS